jgi:mannosyl-3-phosphoglycerate synthase
MILELPIHAEHFGGVRFYDVQRVYELDSGKTWFPTRDRQAAATISTEDIGNVNEKMAIVIPTMNEKLKLLEGVFSGIPHDCHVIVVSASKRSPVDRFMMELHMLKHFNHFVGDEILIIHQQDPGVSEAFSSLNFNSILNEKGLVRPGKAEAMFIGILLAKILGKEYVGFIDADNYVPGAVHEYVEIFAASFLLAESPYSMSRVSWVYKPKIVEDKLSFPKLGRVSQISNYCLNQLIESYAGFGTNIIKTGNSGEHAMSMQLAELLSYASGFAVESYEIVNILEQFGGIAPTHPAVMSSGVDIFQIESRNPHLHEQKGKTHINKMIHSSLGAIYHSNICPENIKKNLIDVCANYGLKTGKEGFPRPDKIEPPSKINIKKFSEILKQKSQTLTELK